jgi:hypothetical protein
MTSKKITVQEILSNIRVQPNRNTWSVLVIDSGDIAEVLEELTDGIEVFIERSVENVNVEERKDSFDIKDINNPRDIDEIFNSNIDYFLLWNFDEWTNTQWQKLDYLRSHLDHEKRCGLLIMSEQAAEKMIANAPNFSSWVDGKIFHLILGTELLTAEETELRLMALREWSRLSDTEVIEKAQNHQLPSEPEYCEWLLLLGRGDLIEH